MYDPLIVDKWLSLQASIPEPATLDRVKALTAHPAFSFANPNRVRALIGAFAMSNPTQSNRADGAGYDFLFWQLRENGIIKPGYEGMIGTPAAGMVPMPVDAMFTPGAKVSLSVLNMSGSEAVPTNYPAAQAIRVAGTLKGYLYRRRTHW